MKENIVNRSRELLFFSMYEAVYFVNISLPGLIRIAAELHLIVQ